MATRDTLISRRSHDPSSAGSCDDNHKRPNKGGHFAAWEQPEYLSGDVRVGFTPLRKQLTAPKNFCAVQVLS
jgi:hypothetical protein